jgi:ribose transport system ATP-binding protein
VLPGGVIEARGISKEFSGNRVLDDVDLRLSAGSVHVLMGENGAGKSTFIKILCGIHQPDSGSISLEGRRQIISNPGKAIELGIRVVHQEFNLVPSLTVAENIHLGRLPTHGPFRLCVDRKAMHRKSEELLALLGTTINPLAEVSELCVADRQLVEIARSLVGKSKVLILDEPSAALGASEVDRLLETVERLANFGVAILYVSHRMEEIRRIGDQVTVLRDGQCVLSTDVESVSDDQLIEEMVGRKVANQYPQRSVAHGKILLHVSKLSSTRAHDDVTLSLREGEVLGIAGPLGCGNIELGESIFGVREVSSGKIEVDGIEAILRSPSFAIESGIAFVPQDRKTHGIMAKTSVLANTTSCILRELSPRGIMQLRRERLIVDEFISKIGVVTASLSLSARNLSGGNQQKIVLGRWLLRDARIYILTEPTRGIDVGAKEAIYRLINELVGNGAAVLLLSSDLKEIVGMSDRVLVMRRGQVVNELSGNAVTAENILSCALCGEVAVGTA